VFDALDQDHDGRLTPDDVRLGFGAALSLTTV
jgi:transaldolase